MARVTGLFAGVVAVAALVVCLGTGPAYSGETAKPAAPAAAPGTAPAAGSGARISATPMEFDFGTIDEGDKPMAKFTIKNTGTDKLVIYDAKPSCGCTLANLSSKEVAPGATATLEAIFNSQNARGGPVSKYVTVKTNDPANPSVVLRIKANVNAKPAPMLTLSPFRAESLNLKSGAAENRVVKLSNTGQLDLHITEVTTSAGISAKVDKFDIAPGKTVKLALVVKPGETRSVEVKVAPAAKPGPFQEVVTFRSDAKGMPATVFVARGTVQ